MASMKPLKHKMTLAGVYLCSPTVAIDPTNLTNCTGRVTCEACKTIIDENRKSR